MPVTYTEYEYTFVAYTMSCPIVHSSETTEFVNSFIQKEIIVVYM